MATAHPPYEDRIIVDPDILVGKPVIRGTRISVELVLKRLSQDLNMQTIFEAYPRLTPEDIKACLAYAHNAVARESERPARRTAQRRTARTAEGDEATNRKSAELTRRGDALYAKYVKPLEKDHNGEYAAVADDGRVVLAPSLIEVMEMAEQRLDRGGNFLFKVGDIAVDWLR